MTSPDAPTPDAPPSKLFADYYRTRDVSEPRGVVRVMKDRWWWCIAGDASRALFYVGKNARFASPQCNVNRAICERIRPPHPDAELVYLPVAFAPEPREGTFHAHT